MALTFEYAGLAALLADAQACWQKGIRKLNGEFSVPGFWLVGDLGVYLMHNGEGWQVGKALYCEESNPHKQGFDAWWYAKQTYFGPEDGQHFIPAALVETAVETRSRLTITKLDDENLIVHAESHAGGMVQ